MTTADVRDSFTAIFQLATSTPDPSSHLVNSILNLASITISPQVMGVALMNASADERREMVRVAAVEVKGTVLMLTKNIASGMDVGAVEQRYEVPSGGVSLTGEVVFRRTLFCCIFVAHCSVFYTGLICALAPSEQTNP
jgi:hypothetical protein